LFSSLQKRTPIVEGAEGLYLKKEWKEGERRVVLSEVLKHEVNEGDYNAGLK
jgi:hypothetical protein